MAANNPILRGNVVGQIPVQRKSWLGRNWKWLLLVSFLVMVCFGLGIFALIMSWMRSSDVALEALARAQANPAVVQRLGARIDEGWLTSGSINVGTGGTGDADLTVPISGPKGKGAVYVTARRIAGVWNYSEMIAAIEGSGEKIDLLSGPVQSQSTSPSPSAPNPQNQGTATSDPAAAVPPVAQPSGPVQTVLAAVSSGVIQSQDTSTSGVVGELIQCRRSGGVLTVKLRYHNTTAAGISFYALPPNSGYERYYLAAANKKYFILKDTDGTYLAPGFSWDCGQSGVCEKLGPGQSITWWAKFPAPSADVTKLDLFTPATPPFEDVPIADN
jgi:Cytochrome oxidase complex assembly protein 1